jgi:hypothetical protein
MEVKRLCYTLGDNIIPAVRFWIDSYEGKETILIMARQHPCETVSSFVCEGMMNYLIK